MVRQDNFCHPLLGQAAIVITPTQYDKRALTCTDILALTNSLLNLSYMTTASSVRIAHHLAADGGLELIVSTLNSLQTNDNLSKFAFSAGLTCLCNISIRGNQRLRERLVEAGVINVVIDLLFKVVSVLEKYKNQAQEEAQCSNPEIFVASNEQPHNDTAANPRNTVSESDRVLNSNTASMDSLPVPGNSSLQSSQQSENQGDSMEFISEATSLPNTALNSRRPSRLRLDTELSTDTVETLPEDTLQTNIVAGADRFGLVMTQIDENAAIDTTAPNLFDNPMMTTPTFAQATANFNNPQALPMNVTQPPLNRIAIMVNDGHEDHAHMSQDESDDYDEIYDEEEEEDINEVLYRVDDILLAVKLIAYLSKYPTIRAEMHCDYQKNVFSLIEVFTSSSNLYEIKKWAVLCMRNAFKKDTTPGSLRRCGNLKCSNWETYPRQYSKCSRCRRVSYCSKACQKQAWPFHRNWCNKYEPQQEQIKQSTEVVASEQSAGDINP